MVRKRFIIPPYTFELEKARVTILEVTKVGIDERNYKYLVTLYVEFGGYRSKVFNLLVSNNQELIEKLRAEIAKMRLFILTGQHHLFLTK